MSELKFLENDADLFSEQEIAVAFYCWMVFVLNTRPMFQIPGVSESIANLFREIVNADSSLEFRILREISDLDPNKEIRKLGMYWFTRFFRSTENPFILKSSTSASSAIAFRVI